MLVLSRKRTEALVIGEGVRVTILKVERNHVRIGIEAPNSVTVLRAELLGKEPRAARTNEADAPPEAG